MNLLVIRHAEAVSRSETESDDASRPLTEEGRAQAQQLARALQRIGVPIDAFVSSPLLRAMQTAEEIRTAWSGSAPELHQCDELAPGIRHKKLCRWLLGLGEENVALVGHEPDLGEFIARMIGSKKAEIHLPKAGVALVTCDGEPVKSNGRLVWMLTPELCNSLAGSSANR
jgi:phosphohistidine phosphatase